MSYALRNTLILLFVLLLISGSGWAYMYYFQEDKIEILQNEVSTKNNELAEMMQIANQYEIVLTQVENARYYINNYDKALYASSNEDKVFDFVNTLNTGNTFTDFSFSFVDSTAESQYGIIQMGISGEGYYRNFNNFIRKIEQSKPLNKIKSVSISPINELESYGRVNFSFTLESFYDRANILEAPSLSITSSALGSVYNPFFPLIRDIEPNDDNLTNVESSELLALSANKVFLVDQTGVMQKINVGEKVYLGTLQSIDLNNRSATFELNKGGLIEYVTLEVQQ